MDKSNYQNVIALSNNEKHRNKVKLILTEKYEDEIKPVEEKKQAKELDFKLQQVRTARAAFLSLFDKSRKKE